jgi:hypothetical protein
MGEEGAVAAAQRARKEADPCGAGIASFCRELVALNIGDSLELDRVDASDTKVRDEHGDVSAIARRPCRIAGVHVGRDL